MPDYAAAFELGLKNAATKDATKNKVKSILQEVSRQIKIATKNLAEFRYAFEKDLITIEVIGTGGWPCLKIATIRLTPLGFPCFITSGASQDKAEFVTSKTVARSCQDEVEFETAIEDLLRDPVIAGTILTVARSNQDTINGK
jgi:hypothetical protein